MTQLQDASDEPRDAGAAERLRALQILSEITSTLPGESGIEEWLGRVLATMVRLAGAAAGAVRVLSADGRELRLLASEGLPPEVVARERLMPVDCGPCGLAVRDAASQEEPAWSTCARLTATTWFGGLGRMIAVPLVNGGRVLGTYNLFLRDARPIPEEVALLYRSMGEHLGMALENARLARENLRMRVTSERQMIAAEVHDSLAQSLAYMKMRVALLLESLRSADTERSLRYAGDLQRALGEAYADLRELLAQFRSRMDPLGLVHALEGLAAGFEDATGVALTLENRLAGALNLTADEEANAFHVVQEALANVARHSGARHARVTLATRDGDYEFTVEDDGVGFFALGNPPGAEDALAPRHRLGVGIMRERAGRLAGRLEIANLPGRGARVRLAFPVDPAARAATP
ncbi:MAG: GAF domain-containing protein [Burkholderiales bacterium]|nr:GAF domain-containing protein [Burkholderiales bacterium]